MYFNSIITLHYCVFRSRILLEKYSWIIYYRTIRILLISNYSMQFLTLHGRGIETHLFILFKPRNYLTTLAVNFTEYIVQFTKYISLFPHCLRHWRSSNPTLVQRLMSPLNVDQYFNARLIGSTSACC